METRTPNIRALVLPVVFTLACVVLTLLVYHRFGGPLPLEPKGYRVSIPVRDAANLATGSDVQIAGVDVGKVVSVERAGRGSVAVAELDHRFAPLGSGARAVVRSKTLIGEAYVEIAPGAPSAPPIPDGGRLAARQVQPSVQLDEFLETFPSGTREDLRNLFAGVDRALDGQAPALNSALGRAAPFSADLASVLGALDRQGVALERLFAASGEVFEAAGAQAGTLRAAVRAADDVLSATGHRDQELAATVRELPGFLEQLRDTSRTLARAAPDLNRAMRSVEPAAPLVRPALAEIREAAPHFRGLFEDLPELIAGGNRGLPSVRPITRAARTGLRAFYPMSRELIPTLELLAVNRLSLIFFFANVAQVMNGTFIGPGGIPRNYGVGITTMWNETVAGWKHKLPSNRQNPYPKPPDALLDTGRIGYIKSYDCRNVNNPPLLPPLGTGAPPCVTQGPWEFNGKSAYYPRLTLAPR